jgi:hypothetical protein
MKQDNDPISPVISHMIENADDDTFFRNVTEFSDQIRECGNQFRLRFRQLPVSAGLED